MTVLIFWSIVQICPIPQQNRLLSPIRNQVRLIVWCMQPHCQSHSSFSSHYVKDVVSGKHLGPKLCPLPDAAYFIVCSLQICDHDRKTHPTSHRINITRSVIYLVDTRLIFFTKCLIGLFHFEGRSFWLPWFRLSMSSSTEHIAWLVGWDMFFVHSLVEMKIYVFHISSKSMSPTRLPGLVREVRLN